MANIKSAKKRIKVINTKTERNKAIKTKVKTYIKMIPPVGNQTYMLQLLYYIFYRNPSCILLTEDGNDKKDLRIKGEYSNG